jgi:hypothetical protein
MSQILSLLTKGLKPQHVEQRSLRKAPPIPFVPPITEVIGKGKKDNILVTISKSKFEEKHDIFYGGSNECYLQFYETVEGIICKKDLYLKHLVWTNEKDSASSDLDMLELQEPKMEEI